jgi:hypothetical protein
MHNQWRALPSIVLALLLPFAAIAASNDAAPKGHRAQNSERWKPNPFILLALHLRDADLEQRRAFVRIALEELIYAYSTEVAITPDRRDRARDPMKYRRWARGTNRFITDLRAIYDTLEVARVVSLTARPPEKVLLAVDDHVAVIAGPRIGSSQSLEDLIRARFCNDWDCPAVTPSQPVRAASRGIRSQPVWSFRAGGRTTCETEDGIAIEFANRDDLASKRDVCAQFVHELRQVSDVIASAHESGARIQWKQVRIVPLGSGRPEQLVLNDQGDYLLGSWPYLASSNALLRRSMPWLQARHEGLSHRLTLSSSTLRIVRVAGASSRSISR